ncbi:hypothetical protein Q5425_06100 [Amycolatopsis sp. A133]|uniref:hypothetical protein n=1 Tax=Amycolatopsis sp. A133 TaxID=3064472 RepID=UPI0027F38AB8|nr:hypothetical protein [Amycolatopsis sp. A133]MDQ7803293.1 hypothetical protein [Amycolatopsis sp. A133]
MTEPMRPVRVLSQRRRVIRGDASLIVGLPPTTGLQYLVLLAAAAVDVVAFNQVLTQALDEYEWALWGFVGGFTVVCLALSHTAGKNWKEASVQRHAPNANRIATVCAGVWLALGLAAFAFRLFYAVPVNGTTAEYDDPAQAPAADVPLQANLLPAILFLVLYLGTGVLSGAGAYKLHNPAARQWARAVAKRSRAAARLADLEAGLLAAERFADQVTAMRKRADDDRELYLALPDSSTAKVVADTDLKLLGRGPAEDETGSEEDDENDENRKDQE